MLLVVATTSVHHSAVDRYSSRSRAPGNTQTLAETSAVASSDARTRVAPASQDIGMDRRKTGPAARVRISNTAATSCVWKTYGDEGAPLRVRAAIDSLVMSAQRTGCRRTLAHPTWASRSCSATCTW